MENSKGLLEALQLEKERLAKNHQVPVDELRNLVFTTYSCGMINEGRAVQLLYTNRLDFRWESRDWVKHHPDMDAIWNGFTSVALDEA
jgi:hypothetical protein